MKIESIIRLTQNTLAFTAALAFCLFCFAGCEHHQSESKPNASQGSSLKTQGEEKAAPSNQAEANTSEPDWIGKPVQLFDGKTLEGWETISFGGEGECSVDKE